jgi:Prefoldin, molecular chaperone implicated in de novo protein folding, alpha subunit
MSDVVELPTMRQVANYQFGAGAGSILFPHSGTVRIQRSKNGRPSQIIAQTPASPSADGPAEQRLVSYGIDGRFTLGPAGGQRLVAGLDPPAYRVVVGDESVPFVRDGRNAFAKFVRQADPAIRPGDETLVVDKQGSLLGVGRAEIDAAAMTDFDRGMAVQIRAGFDD